MTDMVDDDMNLMMLLVFFFFLFFSVMCMSYAKERHMIPKNIHRHIA